MIYFDVTNAGRGTHRSGLMRVSTRLHAELGPAATAVRWDAGFRAVGQRVPLTFSAGDWVLTGELFAADERPGFAAFLAAHACRTAAIFHDAIPLKHPHITWPQSVSRHPGYLKLLAGFDRVWAVSDASRRELEEFWRWQGTEKTPPVDPLALGADFNARPRSPGNMTVPPYRSGDARHLPSLLCVGIVEPRKNQPFLLGVCEELWDEGLAFELHVVGRVNPHFGAPIMARLKSLRRKHPAFLHYHEAASDTVVAGLYATACATAFPTLAEGCGLPLLESLWMGVPCVCSDLPVLLENAAGGGCVPVPLNDATAWKSALRRILTDDDWQATLRAAATSRPLPRWADAAQTVRAALV